MKPIIGLEKVILNKINGYNNTEFYPRNYVLASGEFNWANNAGEVFTILISIMKINETCFTAMGKRSCSNISSAEECRKTFADDSEMDEDYYEDLTPEYVSVILVYDSDVLQYRTISFATDELSTMDGIITSEDFNHVLYDYVDALLNTDAGKSWLCL